jgi:hypothetical protein
MFNKFYLGNRRKDDRRVGHVARTGEIKIAHNILVGKPEGRKPLGRSRCRWKDNIKTDPKEIGNMDVIWIHLT